MYHYLYKITNLINNKYYYGIHSTENLDDGYMGSGTYLNNAIKKYGIENFKKEILEFRDTREEISELESEIVVMDLVKNPDCYNIRLGGDDGKTFGTATMRDEDGNTRRVAIDSDEYKNMKGLCAGKVCVFDIENEEYVSIPVEEFYKNKDKYKTLLSGRVLAYDITQNKYVNISHDEYMSNKDRYIHNASGKVLVVIDGENTHISQEEFEKGNYSTPWTGKKHSEETKQKISELHKINKYQVGEKNSQYNTCYVRKDGKNKRIKKDKVEEYLQNGYTLGGKFENVATPALDKLNVEEFKKDIYNNLTLIDITKKYGVSKKTVRTFISIHNLNSCWISKDGECKKIFVSELEQYIKEGWKKGKLISEETKRKMSIAHMKK